MKKITKEIRVGNIRYDLNEKGCCFQFVVFHDVGNPCNIIVLSQPIHIETEKFKRLVENNKTRKFYF